MFSRFRIDFDELKLADAFGVMPEDIRAFMTDGRRASFIIERRLKWAHEGWTLAPSEGSGFDLRSPTNELWEVRSLTRGGVYFTPSAQVGSGRKFEEQGFLAKLDGVAGFILSDLTKFPSIPVIVIPVCFVRKWWAARELGVSAKVNYATFYKRLEPQLPRELFKLV